MSKQEQKIEELTKPKEELVNEKLEKVDDQKEKDKKQQKKEEAKVTTTTTTTTKPGQIQKKLTPAEELLKKHKEQILKGHDQSRAEDIQLQDHELDEALGFKDVEVTEKQMIQDQADYQRKRVAYFRIESRKDWHRIPIFEKYDEDGNPIYKLKAYRFFNYSYELREVIDDIRAKYDDLNRQKIIFDIVRGIRDPDARIVSQRAVEAMRQWLDVGRTFLLHMNDDDFKRAHKDFILLMVDCAMYAQETKVPNLQIKSSDTSAEEKSNDPDSPEQSGIQ